MKTLVIGASENPDRYACKAARSLLQHGHVIELLGQKTGQIAGQPIQTGHPTLTDIDTVTLYVGPQHQPALYEYVEQLKPRRVIFNPGTENAAFAQRLHQTGIEPIEACTLVMLATNQW
jgi:uncharacterized protein